MADEQKMHYAGFWIRLCAWLLDALLVWLPAFILGSLLTLATTLETPYYVLLAAAAVFLIYYEGVKGGTPGKLICGLRIIDEKQNTIGVPRALLRAIGKWYSSIILFIGYVMIAFDVDKQGLHDKLAKTYVIYKNKEYVS